MNITLKCPACGKLISVECSPGIEEKSAECPKCKEKHSIGSYLPCLSIKVEEKNYQLHFGKQWVGRKVPAQAADIQIPDESGYMSRRHAIINVACAKSGLSVTFEEHGTNPTQMQGVSLEADDIVYLNVNDCLTLGYVRMFLANEFG